ncbi:tripartite tricarboxylate transporter TctB family protein [Nocardioides houyundeii]|uniref:tripartite tricarboxylate transporter TctB family protein n=1 Tax=Nocardioides houyundeii TaxID=2045452 RepID=UPI000DF339DF|nr:tripartite tricarboxylate transporter TctB family protein [Nocardioides houyundeii]
MSDRTDEQVPHVTGLERETPQTRSPEAGTGAETETETGAGTGTARPRGTGWIASKVPLLAVLAAVLVFYSQLGEMSIGSMSEPGPGLWPAILLGAILAFAALGLVVDLRDGIESFEWWSTLRVLAGFVALGAFVILFQQTGMIAAGIVFLMLWLKGLNLESWRLSIMISVAAPVVTYLLFVEALGVRFPEDVVASLWTGR